MKTIVIDNGAGTCKVGWAGQAEPFVIPNCIAKRRKSVSGARSGVFVGDQLESDECDTYAQLVFKRPHDRGYLVDCESEAAIWSRAFSAQVLNVPQRQPSDVRLLLSRPLFQPSALQRDTNELVFEHFGFGALACLSTPLMASLALTSNSGGSGGSGGSSGSNNISNFSNISGNIGNNSISNNSGNNSINNSSGDTSNSGSASVMAQMRETRSMLLVDSGFSFSHVVPVLRGRVCLEAVRRVNVGGKALTNYLKELLSLRQYDMSEETHLVNVIKERLCFVSLDFMGDLNASRLGASGVASHLGVSGVGNHGKASLENPIRQRYVLPDYTHSKLGYVKAPGESVVPDEQIVTMNNERFTVPEILFHPSDIGMNQAGLPEAIIQSVEQSNCFDDEEKQLLYDSVVLTGGNSLLKNYRQRMTNELRSLIPQDYDLNVFQPHNPVTVAWQGGSIFATRPEFHSASFTVTRQEYEEHGHDICTQKFIL